MDGGGDAQGENSLSEPFFHTGSEHAITLEGESRPAVHKHTVSVHDCHATHVQTSGRQMYTTVTTSTNYC